MGSRAPYAPESSSDRAGFLRPCNDKVRVYEDFLLAHSICNDNAAISTQGQDGSSMASWRPTEGLYRSRDKSLNQSAMFARKFGERNPAGSVSRPRSLICLFTIAIFCIASKVLRYRWRSSGKGRTLS